MEVIILAGGLGTRLQSAVHDVPKPMADIGGRPFLAHLLDYFAGQQASRILLSVGYKRDIIMRYFGGNYKGMEICYIEEDRPLGTGGALRRALKYAREDTVIAANGDSFLALDLQDMIRFHQQQGASMTIAGKTVPHHGRYGAILVHDHRAVGFLEKGAGGEGCINGGVYVITRNHLIRALGPYDGAFSFEADFLFNNILKLNVCVYMTDGFFIDIGIPEDYRKAQKTLALEVRERLL